MDISLKIYLLLTKVTYLAWTSVGTGFSFRRTAYNRLYVTCDGPAPYKYISFCSAQLLGSYTQ